MYCNRYFGMQQTDAELLEHWCAPETLQQVAAFVENTIKRRA